MARVMLVNPPWYVFLGMSSSSPQPGLMSLAGFLAQAGHQVAIFNADVFGHLYASDLDVVRARRAYTQRLKDLNDPVWNLTEQRIREWGPDVVGVHVKTPSWSSGCQVARLAKAAFPSVLTVCGGPHVSCAPENVANETCFDYGVIGEGERTLLDLITSHTAGQHVSPEGVVVGNTRPPLIGPRAPLIDDLDALPHNGCEFLMDRDRHNRGSLGSVFSARGCPFQCRYCASHRTWGRRVRYRSAQSILAEISYLTERHGVSYFEFCDDTFTLSKRRAHQICDLLLDRYPKMRWKCTTRADCLDEELVLKMANAGCTDVSIGVESGSPRILELIGKGETKESIAKGCRLLRQYGIRFAAFVMIGFPTESAEDAEETLRFAKSLGADSLVGSVVTPYPGTDLYEWARKEGRLPEDHCWDAYYHQSTGMGLWNLPREAANEMIAAWFKDIETYNHRLARLTQRFVARFKADPFGAIRRACSVVLSRTVGRG